MARLKGPLKITGLIDGLSFYETKEGHIIARRKTGPREGVVATSPNYVRTRENNQEFARASKGSGLLRRAVAGIAAGSMDTTRSGRLQKLLRQVIKGDLTNARGERNIHDGNMALLEGFEWNNERKLLEHFRVLYEAGIDREQGICRIDIPAFVPVTRTSFPEGCSHIQFTMLAASVDFKNGEFTAVNTVSDLVPLNAILAQPLSLELPIEATEDLPLFLLLGMRYYHSLLNGSQEVFKGKAAHGLMIVKVVV